MSHMLTVVRPLKTSFSKMASRDVRRRRIESAVCEKEKYQCGKDWGVGGAVCQDYVSAPILALTSLLLLALGTFSKKVAPPVSI